MEKLTGSGLPLSWDRASKRLLLGEGVEAVAPRVYRPGDMQEVLRGAGGNEARVEGPDRPLYYVYPEVHLERDRKLFREKGIRYKLTLLPPGRVGEEYVKTAGCYHPFKAGTDSTYPEVYEVLCGRAHFLLQKPRYPRPFAKELERVILLMAGPGEKVLIPPGFGHLLLNPAEDCLATGSLSEASFIPLGEPYRCRGGGAYFQLAAERQEEPLFIPNRNYSVVPPLQVCRTMEVPFFSLLKEMPLYTAFLQDPDGFNYLTHPEDFYEEFNTYLYSLVPVKQYSPV